MGRIIWNAPGERFYEAGVDRGVLYVGGAAEGVPWNGLISVSEAPSGGEVTPHYIDGVKYLNEIGNEEFQATIEAFTYPDEFARCDGTLPVANGLFATHQRKRLFGLSYRTKVGNDIDGSDRGYKIHLVYNATASPTNRTHKTFSDSVEPGNFTWEIVTKPDEFAGFKPTAHFVIDSREVPAPLLAEIEDILYGSAEDPPRLPSTPELLFIFENFESHVFDAGTLVEEYFAEFDAGGPADLETSTIDGGGP